MGSAYHKVSLDLLPAACSDIALLDFDIVDVVSEYAVDPSARVLLVDVLSPALWVHAVHIEGLAVNDRDVFVL
jgi:hypothetical protein